MRCVLIGLIGSLSGGTPPSWGWAYYAPSLLTYDITAFQIWCTALVCYGVHGVIIELLPFSSLQPDTHQLNLSEIIPQVCLNMCSCSILTLTPIQSRGISDHEAIWYLMIAALGNEVIYAFIHRLLHTKHLFKYHRMHHKQKAPRALGAAYCSLTEMWIANISSFLIPLYLVNAPTQIYLIWIICGIQTTQIHHSCKKLPWPWSLAHQPLFHDDHHRYVCRNFGNIGVLEFVLQK